MLHRIFHATGIPHPTTSFTMRKPIITLTTAMVVLACGPHAGEEDGIPGKLEYEQLYDRVYRLDRRIDARIEIPGENGERHECGFLTDRAYDDLERTLAALDPSVDYGYDPDVLDCERSDALVYIEGFEHSPFECSYDCCHPDLYWAAVVYSMILNNFFGAHPVVDGEPYVAIDPDQPCP